jgi:glycosyltransferase involved in cell wall biosynthesis
MLAWAPVRILLDYRPALRERTGVGEYAHQLAAAVARRLPLNDTLTLFSSSWKDRLAPDAIPGLPIVDARVPVKLLNLAWHRLEWPAVETLAGEADVAHSMHPLLIPSRRAAQVITIHDLYFLENPEHTSAEIRRDYPALAAGHARRADRVITVSEHTAAEIRSRFGVPPEAITLCPPGAPDWTPLPRRNAAGPILFMGTLEPRKNVGALVRAYGELLARNPDAPPLVLAGRVAPACEAILNDLQRPPLAGHARHIGYVNPEDRERLYREASMLVLPSLKEGFGIPVLEAMTLGLPVIVSNRGALPEVAGDAGLQIDPTDPGAIASAMECLFRDADLAARRGAAGIARARRFSWDASAARLIDAYASAVERRRSRQ